MRGLVEEVLDRFGRIGILVNNAGDSDWLDIPWARFVEMQTDSLLTA